MCCDDAIVSAATLKPAPGWLDLALTTPLGIKTFNKPSQFSYISLICLSRGVNRRASMPFQKA